MGCEGADSNHWFVRVLLECPLRHNTSSKATELGPHGITVNAYAPGTYFLFVLCVKFITNCPGAIETSMRAS
jgi:NAD(P)-dependent dehydrogenase (short-subunit alcohol dehydrogenase family)